MFSIVFMKVVKMIISYLDMVVNVIKFKEQIQFIYLVDFMEIKRIIYIFRLI
jgi:hypothetical protein